MHFKGVRTYIDYVRFFKLVHSPWCSCVGCGVNPPNVMVKVKKDEDLVKFIQGSRIAYGKGCKGAWVI